MRPRAVRSDTLRGRYGDYFVPNVAAVDTHIRALTATLATASAVAQARIHDDLDALLDRRLALMREAKT